MAKDLHTFVALVRRNLERTGEQLDRTAEAYLAKPAAAFNDADFERLRDHPDILALFAQYEREEAHLRMLEEELSREGRDASSLLAQAELDEEIEGGE